MQIGVEYVDFSDVLYPQQQPVEFSALSPSVHWAKLHRTLKNHEYPLRRIYDFELLYLIEGRITAHLGENEYPLASGELLFISAGVSHKINVETDKALFLGIHFDFFDEFFIQADQDIIVREDALEPSNFCREAVMSGYEAFSAAPVWQPAAETVKEMERLIDAFNQELPGTDILCKGIMLQLLVGLFRSKSPRQRALRPQSRERLALIADWIEANYTRNCSNQALAELINVHEDYMSKQFKAVFGMTPNKYLQMIRHREAKRLLRETDETVEWIGNAVGYEDVHYFSRTFKRWENLSPREYRNLVQVY